jgi:hypothetical protein
MQEAVAIDLQTLRMKAELRALACSKVGWGCLAPSWGYRTSLCPRVSLSFGEVSPVREEEGI